VIAKYSIDSLSSLRMSTIQQVKALLYKDLTIEFRNRYLLGGIALYVVSSVLVVYFAMLYSGAAVLHDNISQAAMPPEKLAVSECKMFRFAA
jgi:hypothetical protein